MAALPPKYCPACRAEYLHTADWCPDCDVALAPSLEPEGPAGETLAAASELAPLLRDAPWELQRSAQALQAAGVPSRIDALPDGVAPATPGGGELCLYVRPEDRAAAEQLVHEYRAATLPDAPEAGRFGESLGGCPACGSELSEGATGCAECGLEFPAVRFLCHACGAEMSSDDEQCPSCGARLEPDGED